MQLRCVALPIESTAISTPRLFVAARTGLWVRETSTEGPLEDEVPTRGRASRGREDRFERDDADRPEHVTREDPTKARTFGT